MRKNSHLIYHYQKLSPCLLWHASLRHITKIQEKLLCTLDAYVYLEK